MGSVKRYNIKFENKLSRFRGPSHSRDDTSPSYRVPGLYILKEQTGLFRMNS
jgi:hypothetical protein